MTRFPHDQFAKDYLKELLKPLGDVQAPREVPGEVRQIDVWFAPSSQPTADSQVLGLLGRFASSPCLLEPFRNAVTPDQVRSCISKLFDVHADERTSGEARKDKRERGGATDAMDSFSYGSVPLLEGFKATLDEENWLAGVYFLGNHLKTALVVIHQLPRTEATLWLRILGKGTVQKQAISELAALSTNHPLRANALLLLTNLQANLQTSENLDQEEQELIMELSPLVLQWREEARQEGRQEGKQEGRQEGRQEGERVVIENLLKVRFGELDEELVAIVEPVLELPAEEFTRLLLQLSREELLARFERRFNEFRGIPHPPCGGDG